jgi:phospholipid-transporting ATPase
VIGAEGYSASSPDELALVNTAKYLGYEFSDRKAQDNSIQVTVQGETMVYYLLQTFEFTSSRKRMTSVFRTPEG